MTHDRRAPLRTPRLVPPREEEELARRKRTRPETAEAAPVAGSGETTAAASGPSGRGLLAADIAAGACFLFYALLKAYALAPALSDENIYFYMCRRIAEGALPYRDFFFAHPPLHLLPGSVVMLLAGFHVPLAKAIPATAAGLAGLAIYRAGRRGGPWRGLLALILFLFSYDMLRASSHYTGSAEATALIAWALERALAGRPRLAGALAACAGLTAFYSVPAGVAILVWMILKKDRAARDYAIAYGGIFIGVNLLFAAAFQSRYWDPVFRYHFMKPPGGPGNLASALRAITRENAWIMWGAPAALAGLFLLRERSLPAAGKRKRGAERAPLLADSAWGAAAAGLLTAGLHLAFFALLERVYTFYVLPAFPGIALAGGAAYAAAFGRLRRGIRPPASRPALAAALVILVVPIFLPSLFPLRGIDAEEGDVLRRYTWRDAPLPGWLNAAVKAVVWKDERVEGAWDLAPTRYLWHESRRFTAPDVLAARVRAVTPAGGTIFGDSSSAPLVALLAGRRLTHDEADTNSMRYRSGITPPEQAIATLEKSPPAAVVVSQVRGFFLVPEMRAWVTSHYHVDWTYRDPYYGTYNLYLPNTP